MAIQIDIKIDGLAAIEARLLELDAVASERLLRRAVRRSLIPLEKQATLNANRLSRSGALAQSVKIANARPRGQEVVQVQVGPKYRDKRAVALHNVYYRRKRKGIFYGHIVESGHRIGTSQTGWLAKLGRRIGRGGKSGGTVAAKPWFVPAFNATRAGIIPEFQKILQSGLARLERRKSENNANAEGLVDP